MDLHFTSAQATDEERRAVDAVLGLPASGWEGGQRSEADAHVAVAGAAFRSRRHMLLPALHALSDACGFLSPGALNYVCMRLSVPPAEAYGVASFYALFSTTQRPGCVLHVCDDIACMTAGATEICDELEKTVGPAGLPYRDGSITWLRSPCLGQCDRAPAALLLTALAQRPPNWNFRGTELGRIDAKQVRAYFTLPPDPSSRFNLVKGACVGSKLLRRVGKVDAGSFDDYVASGGTMALQRAIELGPSGVIREVVESKLVGRGGAAFSTGRKWEAVAGQPERPHYVVCNADESEPGTFKDRVLMEGDPFALIEAMTIAAIAGACERGFVYIRGEYLRAEKTLEEALRVARSHNLLGENILGRGIRFDIELRRGAGAYICGEETALFNSIEGKRGEPRNKPPFPVQRGLFGKPTIVNNVETLANIPHILTDGGRAYAQTGTADSTGTKLFCVSGHVRRPGLYEVPFGTTLAQLIDLAGGQPSGKRIQAVLLGGAAGSFVTPAELDVQLTFEGVRAIGASLGSGVVMVFDETADLAATLLRIAAFFRDESCGQCVPCRVGTVRQEELLKRVASRKSNGSLERERNLLTEIGQVMRDASICGLGQTASSAIESAFAKLDVFK